MGWFSDLIDTIRDAIRGGGEIKEYGDEVDRLNQEMRDEEARRDAERQAEAEQRAREEREEELRRRQDGGPL